MLDKEYLHYQKNTFHLEQFCNVGAFLQYFTDADSKTDYGMFNS